MIYRGHLLILHYKFTSIKIISFIRISEFRQILKVYNNWKPLIKSEARNYINILKEDSFYEAIRNS